MTSPKIRKRRNEVIQKKEGAEIPTVIPFHGKFGTALLPGIFPRTCDVWDCPEEAVFTNPESKLRYCQNHARALGYRIVHYSHSGNAVALVRIAKARYGRKADARPL
jgi:hypothetical protein